MDIYFSAVYCVHAECLRDVTVIMNRFACKSVTGHVTAQYRPLRGLLPIYARSLHRFYLPRGHGTILVCIVKVYMCRMMGEIGKGLLLVCDDGGSGLEHPTHSNLVHRPGLIGDEARRSSTTNCNAAAKFVSCCFITPETCAPEGVVPALPRKIKPQGG